MLSAPVLREDFTTTDTREGDEAPSPLRHESHAAVAGGGGVRPGQARPEKPMPPSVAGLASISHSQLFQALCLVGRLLLVQSHRHSGADHRALDQFWFRMDEKLFTGLSDTVERDVTSAELFSLAAALPSKIQVDRSVDPPRMRVRVSVVPSIDEISQWGIDDHNANANNARKRPREDAPGDANMSSTAQRRESKFGPPRAQAPASGRKATGADRTPLAHLRQHQVEPVSPQIPSSIRDLVSDAKLAAVKQTLLATDEAERFKKRVAEQRDLDRLLALYDLVRTILGETRRCYSFNRLVTTAVCLGRFNEGKEAVERQLLKLVEFRSSGFSLVAPVSLFADGGRQQQQASDENDSLPPSGRSSSTEGDFLAKPAEEQILVLDRASAERNALAAEIDEAKYRLLASDC